MRKVHTKWKLCIYDATVLGVVAKKKHKRLIIDLSRLPNQGYLLFHLVFTTTLHVIPSMNPYS